MGLTDIEAKQTKLTAVDRSHVLICAGAACVASGAMEMEALMKAKISELGLTCEVSVFDTGCVGTCDLGPVVVVYPEGTFYVKVKPKDAEEIVTEHLLKGRVVERLLSRTPEEHTVPTIAEHPFFAKQQRIALRNLGVINPEDIQEYVALGGYSALAKALTMTQDEVIQMVLDSGLRGRGGAGFPTGRKWAFAKEVEADQKYVIINGDEGDPGAFMDRSILEGDPHSVIEGLAIAAYCIGATQGYAYVRAEYPLAIKRLQIAIDQAREFGLLGAGIFDKLDFDIEIRKGAGAFVCGEETALMHSIEGLRGEPRPKPPFPAVSGLWGKPTIINNVETLASVPVIVEHGPDWYSAFGTETSKGTKVFALAGNINNTGLIEVPFGTTLRDVVFEIGGGIPRGKAFKAAQTGGPSGGCIPASMLDISLDYESLQKAGSIVGSGGLIIMDEDTCMVDVARFFLEFTVDESCGQCTPCREGVKRMLEILTRITEGKGELADISKLEMLAGGISKTSLCQLGITAPNPVQSTLRYFRDEYIAHVVDKQCPAKVCRALIQYDIVPEHCTGCTLCAKHCPTNAIHGELKGVHTIDQEACIKCGECLARCRTDAVIKV
ncbi:MAG: NADH-quinone oxidoreductase subunit NuoF [Armatimonadetes bacterium]|nr:NADH-quinone oxidoreductase subunit NuoF [Armatimonadota bacterium]